MHPSWTFSEKQRTEDGHQTAIFHRRLKIIYRRKRQKSREAGHHRGKRIKDATFMRLEGKALVCKTISTNFWDARVVHQLFLNW